MKIYSKRLELNKLCLLKKLLCAIINNVIKLYLRLYMQD